MRLLALARKPVLIADKWTMPLAGLITTIGVIVLGIFDLACVCFGGTGSSISNFLLTAGFKSPVMVFAFGFTCGHLFGYMTPDQSSSKLKLFCKMEGKMKFISLVILALAFNAGAEEKPTYQVKQYRENHALGLKRTEASKAFIMQGKRYEMPRKGVASAIPGKVDLSPLVSPPEDQGGCGSCWDFSLTKALRSALMIAGKDPGTLSFNYLLNNCGPGPSQWGCGGGDFDAGKSFLNGAGPWLESEDPYTEREGRCKTGLKVAGTALEMVFLSDRASFEEQATALSQKHVLSIDVAVAGNWGSYSGGIYNGNGSGINHMVNYVGYDCETSVDAAGNCVFVNGQPKNGDGYLILMNNWGMWGEKGYMRTRWGRNQAGTTSAFFRVKEEPVPPTPPGPVPPVPPSPSTPWPWYIWLIIGGGGVLVVFILIEVVIKRVQK